MRGVIADEMQAGRIFLAGWRLPVGVIAMGMVEKVGGVNSRIALLESGEFSTVNEAFALLRPRYFMVKVDLENAYRSLGIASHYWSSQCFEYDGIRYMDTRAPFGNRSFAGDLHEVHEGHCGMDAGTGGAVRWVPGQFLLCRQDGSRGGGKHDVAGGVRLILRALCKYGKVRRSGYSDGVPGILLSTEGEVCTAAIDADRVADVLTRANQLRAQASRGRIRRKALESLMGLLAFCSQVVWNLSLYTMRGFAFLVATVSRQTVRLAAPVLEDLAVLAGENPPDVQRPAGRVASQGRGRKPLRHGCLGHLGFWGGLGEALLPPQLGGFGTDAPEGTTVVVNIDNQSALFQIKRWWGSVAYLPLLKQLFYLCSKHDIRLQPVYISSERGQSSGGLAVPAAIGQKLVEGGGCSGAEVRRLECLGYDLPFSILKEILVNFLRAKKRQQWGTAACFLVPVWPGNPGWDMVASMPELFRVELRRESGRYREEALAPHTRRAYGTGVRAFVTFCVRFACLGCLEPLLPATDDTMCSFITFQSWLFARTLDRAGGSPLFVMEKVSAKKGTVVPMTHEVLVAGSKELAQKVCLEPGSYAGHSLRRGGATAALRLDVNNIYIKLQGDWKSDCFEGY
ncbi:hypothetical protein CYMTET_39335 [Cymbomonas tetramitiformis]|uniref:Uncharacterized protein n=1 Tax=Cymbomonas tetramitiformis TaxID=36881 RepID=A0AAE0F413_9CHLO|nr:hypothetical protein CYMTET_39335 [Cymbomonas tetramitiformis]